MQDVMPEDQRYWNLVLNTAKRLADLYGYRQIDVPVLEYTRLFERGIGQGSDLFVQKEMYTLDEGGKKDLTLRPEFTAGVARAYLQNGMGQWPQPAKIYLHGPIFRRERPQAGRYRQHTQFDIEILGETDPAADAEVMSLAMHLCRELGYTGLQFQVNSTGCRDCRPHFISALTDYLQGHIDDLSAVDKERLTKNPLRVLDSKAPNIDAILADGPRLAEYLCEDCATHFADLRGLLDSLGMNYAQNDRLVRGLDYYEKTVFELWADGIGAQAAVFGGGRYNLTPELGGHSVPSVGFGSGIERIILGLKAMGVEPPPEPEATVLVAHFGGETKRAAFKLADDLRRAGVATQIAFARGKRSMKSQMREANKRGVRFVLILGESEMANGQVMARPMSGGDQVLVAQSELPDWLKAATLD